MMTAAAPRREQTTAELSQLRIPLVMAVGMWCGVVMGSVAVGGFIWQAYDTRMRVADVATALTESNKYVASQLTESNKLVQDARREFASEIRDGFKSLGDRYDHLAETVANMNAKVERIDERTEKKNSDNKS